jgi:hypothetical protein
MRILVYRGKYEKLYWLAGNNEQLQAAFKKLFAVLDNFCCYDDDVPGIAAARNGDIKVIEKILHERKDCEYEGWDFICAADPLDTCNTE